MTYANTAAPPTVRDNHVVSRPNTIEDQDPGDHDDSVERAVVYFINNMPSLTAIFK